MWQNFQIQKWLKCAQAETSGRVETCFWVYFFVYLHQIYVSVTLNSKKTVVRSTKTKSCKKKKDNSKDGTDKDLEELKRQITMILNSGVPTREITLKECLRIELKELKELMKLWILFDCLTTTLVIEFVAQISCLSHQISMLIWTEQRK